MCFQYVTKLHFESWNLSVQITSKWDAGLYFKGALVSVTLVFEISIEIHQSRCIIITNPSVFYWIAGRLPLPVPVFLPHRLHKACLDVLPQPQQQGTPEIKKSHQLPGYHSWISMGKNVHCVFTEHLLLYVELCSQYLKLKYIFIY